MRDTVAPTLARIEPAVVAQVAQIVGGGADQRIALGRGEDGLEAVHPCGLGLSLKVSPPTICSAAALVTGLARALEETLTCHAHYRPAPPRSGHWPSSGPRLPARPCWPKRCCSAPAPSVPQAASNAAPR